ncbi:MAG: hypothetical protein ACJ72D_16885, partial [Marmoricola sp.]
DDGAVRVGHSPAHDDGSWIAIVGPDRVAPLQAVVRAVDPYLDVEVTGTDQEWTARVVRRDEAAAEAGEVAVTRFSTGAAFEFEHRKALPLIVV